MVARLYSGRGFRWPTQEKGGAFIFFRKALLLLSNRKPVFDISVKDICDKAGLSKRTFYNHYADLTDLVTDCWRSHMALFGAS